MTATTGDGAEVRSAAVQAALESIRAATGWAHAALLVRTPAADDGIEVLASAGPAPGDDWATRQWVVLAPGDEVIAGSVLVADPTGPALDADQAAAVRGEVLAVEGTVLRAWTVHEEARRAARTGPALLSTLTAVRTAEDEVGNSLAVVLGWLRLSEGSGIGVDAAAGGLRVAIRRLDEVQDTIAAILRETARLAVEDHARDPVSTGRLLAELGHPVDPDDDAVILANRALLADFLREAGDGIVLPGVRSADAWTLPLAPSTALGTALVTALHAAGGTLVARASGYGVAWPLAPDTATR